MAISEEELQATMADTSLVNVPSRLAGRGLTGPRPVISRAEQRERRETMARMLAAGASNDAQEKAMAAATKPDGTPGFKMTARAVKYLRDEVYAQWREQDAERAPHTKAAATRRIKRDIARASAKHSYSAVAQMERNLMMIEGTAEPIKVEVSGLERVSVAVQQVLNVQSPEALLALVAEEEAHIATHGKAPLLAPGEEPDSDEVIDAECE